MFGIGSGEMVVFAVIALIALGPKRLPEFLKMVGKGVREIRRATTDLRKHSGIDELMRDDPAGLRALSRDINRAPAPRREHRLSAEDRAKESPAEGADLAHANYLSQKKQEQLAAASAAASAPAASAASAPAASAPSTPVVSVPAGSVPAPSSAAPVAGSPAVVAAPSVPIGQGKSGQGKSGQGKSAEANAGFYGDTLPDKPRVVAPATSEPTMMGVPVVDPYADAKVALSLRDDAQPAKPSVPPPPPKEALSKRPSGIPRIPPPPPVPSSRSVPPPPPPPRVSPSGPVGPGMKKVSLPASLPASIPPPAPSQQVAWHLEWHRSAQPTQEAPAASDAPPSNREATMALETEDLNPADES